MTSASYRALPDAAAPAELEQVYHGRDWEELVRDVYGFESLTVRRNGGVLPLFHSPSPLLGNRLLSAVFNGYAGPLYGDTDTCDALVSEAVDRARARNVDWLELRCAAPLPPEVVARHGLETRTPYRLTLLPLGDHPALEAGRNRKFRKNLRVARRHLDAAGVRVEHSLDVADLHAFHDVLVRVCRDRHGTVAQPWRLFEAVRRRFLEPGHGDLWLARNAQGRVLGGALFLCHGGVATGAWSATATVDGRWCLDSVIKDAAIHDYAARGFRWIDFGLSSPRQAGLLFVKSRFGGITTAPPWYVLPVRCRSVPQRDFDAAWPWLRSAWRRLPLPVAKGLSSWLAPRLG